MKKQLVLVWSLVAVIGLVGLLYGGKALADVADFRLAAQDAMNWRLVLRPSEPEAMTPEQFQETREVLRRRLTGLGLTDYRLRGEAGHIEVGLPDHENRAYIIELLTAPGRIEFIAGGQTPPLGQRVETGPLAQPQAGLYQSLFTAEEIVTIDPPQPGEGEIFYSLLLAEAAAARLARFTAQPEAYLCLVIDHQVVNCSNMYHWSGHTLAILPQLSGGYGINMADLALLLNSGPLPLPLEVGAD